MLGRKVPAQGGHGNHEGLALTSDIPSIKLDVLVSDILDVEADSRYSMWGFASVQLKQNGRLACSIKSKKENASMLRPEHILDTSCKKR